MISNKVLLGKERVKEHLKVIFLKIEPQISYWNFSCLIICDLSYMSIVDVCLGKKPSRIIYM